MTLSEGQFKPLDVPSQPKAYNAQVNEMAGRIQQTYEAAGPQEHVLGENFYNREAHGAARAIAADIHPDSPTGKLVRSMPRHSELPERGPVSPRAAAPPEFEGKLDRAAGTIARLSPQTDWGQNVTGAWEAHHMPENALENLITNKRDPSKPRTKKMVDKGEYARADVVDDAGKKMMLNNQPSQQAIHAVEIARGHAPVEKYVSGVSEETESQRNKIGSFYQNVRHPETSPHVTVDFRAHDIAAGRLLATGENRGISKHAKLGSTRTDTAAYGEKQRYNMFEEAHKRATDLINNKRRTEAPTLVPGIGQRPDIQPKQVQAVTWWADKHAQDTAMGGTKVGTAGNLHVGPGKKDRGQLGKPVGQ
jgi:hypothetical protein